MPPGALWSGGPGCGPPRAGLRDVEGFLRNERALIVYFARPWSSAPLRFQVALAGLASAVDCIRRSWGCNRRRAWNVDGEGVEIARRGDLVPPLIFPAVTAYAVGETGTAGLCRRRTRTPTLKELKGDGLPRCGPSCCARARPRLNQHPHRDLRGRFGRLDGLDAGAAGSTQACPYCGSRQGRLCVLTGAVFQGSWRGERSGMHVLLGAGAWCGFPHRSPRTGFGPRITS